VHNEIEPVYGPHQLAFHQHLELFPDMGRRKGGEPEGQTGEDDEPPGHFRNKVHNFKGRLSQRRRVHGEKLKRYFGFKTRTKRFCFNSGPSAPLRDNFLPFCKEFASLVRPYFIDDSLQNIGPGQDSDEHSVFIRNSQPSDPLLIHDPHCFGNI
jgi:hypothetical protein